MMCEVGEMKFIPITWFVNSNIDIDLRTKVSGWAFQVPGFEWFHLWVTPNINSSITTYCVSHWESGLTFDYWHTRGNTKEECARLATRRLNERGPAKLRARLTELGYEV